MGHNFFSRFELIFNNVMLQGDLLPFDYVNGRETASELLTGKMQPISISTLILGNISASAYKSSYPGEAYCWMLETSIGSTSVPLQLLTMKMKGDYLRNKINRVCLVA